MIFNQYMQNPYAQMQNPYVQQNPYVPPNIGATVNMGGMGYNMGPYYGGLPMGYNNPYLIQKQREMQEAQMRQTQIANSDVTKHLYRCANNALGLHKDDMEEHLSKYDPVFANSEKQKEYQENLRVQESYNMLSAQPMQQQNMIPTQSYYLLQERKRMNDMIPENTGLADFFDVIGDEALRLQEEQNKQNMRQVDKLYNRDQYNKLVNMHNQSSSKYFNSMYDNASVVPTTLSDYEVPLPSSLQQRMQARKQAFLNAMPKEMGR